MRLDRDALLRLANELRPDETVIVEGSKRIAEFMQRIRSTVGCAVEETSAAEESSDMGAPLGAFDMRNLRVDLNRAYGLTPSIANEIDDLFASHAVDFAQARSMEDVRVALSNAVKALIAAVPPCPTRETAIRKLCEARMDANSAIANQGRY